MVRPKVRPQMTKELSEEEKIVMEIKKRYPIGSKIWRPIRPATVFRNDEKGILYSNNKWITDNHIKIVYNLIKDKKKGDRIFRQQIQMELYKASTSSKDCDVTTIMGMFKELGYVDYDYSRKEWVKVLD